MLLQSIVVAVVGALGLVASTVGPRALPYVRSHNERTLALQEIELLTRLDGDTEAAQQLSAIIKRRIARWHRKMFPAERRDHIAEEIQESFERDDGPTPRWYKVFRVALVIVFAGLLALGIWGVITSPPSGHDTPFCGLLLSTC